MLKSLCVYIYYGYKSPSLVISLQIFTKGGGSISIVCIYGIQSNGDVTTNSVLYTMEISPFCYLTHCNYVFRGTYIHSIYRCPNVVSISVNEHIAQHCHWCVLPIQEISPWGTYMQRMPFPLIGILPCVIQRNGNAYIYVGRL